MNIIMAEGLSCNKDHLLLNYVILFEFVQGEVCALRCLGHVLVAHTDST